VSAAILVRRLALLTCAMAAGLAAPVAAQTGAVVSVGAEAALYDPSGATGHSLRFAPLVRLRLKSGFGPSASIGGFQAGWGDSARLKVRAYMAGPAYRFERRRLAGSVSMLAGYAFTRLEAAPAGQRLRNTLAWQPSVSLWYDLSESLGLHASVGYLLARPSLAVDGPYGTTTSRIRADAMVLRVGVAYTVF